MRLEGSEALLPSQKMSREVNSEHYIQFKENYSLLNF